MTTFEVLAPATLDLTRVDIPSKRLRLVPVSMAFDRDIFREFSPAVTHYMMPKPADDIEETRAFIRRSQQNMRANQDLTLAIVRRETGEFLGCCGLHTTDTSRQLELGNWLKASAHGHGYGREAITTLVHWTEANIELNAFIYPVDRQNVPSRKIPESLGGAVVREVQVTWQSGRVLDEVVYEIPTRKSTNSHD